ASSPRHPAGHRAGRGRPRAAAGRPGPGRHRPDPGGLRARLRRRRDELDPDDRLVPGQRLHRRRDLGVRLQLDGRQQGQRPRPGHVRRPGPGPHRPRPGGHREPLDGRPGHRLVRQQARRPAEGAARRVDRRGQPRHHRRVRLHRLHQLPADGAGLAVHPGLHRGRRDAGGHPVRHLVLALRRRDPALHQHPAGRRDQPLRALPEPRRVPRRPVRAQRGPAVPGHL
ncbi:MAG: Putative lipase, partial [uncultured Corynebacteriales bacterium]